MWARVVWTDRQGRAHRDLIEQPTCVTTVLGTIEARGGRVSTFNRISRAG